MQLVLLSGGSGKRLWPLSNNARTCELPFSPSKPQRRYEAGNLPLILWKQPGIDIGPGGKALDLRIICE